MARQPGRIQPTLDNAVLPAGSVCLGGQRIAVNVQILICEVCEFSMAAAEYCTPRLLPHDWPTYRLMTGCSLNPAAFDGRTAIVAIPCSCYRTIGESVSALESAIALGRLGPMAARLR